MWHAWQWTGSGTIAGSPPSSTSTRWTTTPSSTACGLTTPTHPDPVEDIVNVLIEFPEDADAKFIGTEDANGLIFQVQWTGPGRNPDGTVNQTTQARLAMLQAKSAPCAG